MNPLRILHLSGRPGWCGESNRVLVECRGLAARGHAVTLGAPLSTAIAIRAKEQGIEVIGSFRFSKGFRPHHTLHDVRALRRLLAARTFDVVHIHTSRDTWPAAIALGPRGSPGRPLLVRTKHHSLPTKSNVHHRWLYGGRVDRLILAGEGLRDSIHELTGDGTVTSDRIAVIHSSIDTARFDPARTDGAKIRREFNLEGRLVIGLVGRVAAEKGHALFLDVLERIAPKYPALSALIVGGGEQLEPLRNRVEGGALKGRVIFTGERSDIPEIVRALDVQVVPSLWLEASPATVKEAMAMNVPVIASRVGSVAEIVEDGVSGLLFPAGDHGEFQAAIERLLSDPALRSRMACGRPRIVQHFSDEHLVAASEALYRGMLGGVG